MIPQTPQELALMIFMMEINEWGLETNEQLHRKLAKQSLDAARVFFDTIDEASSKTATLPSGLQITRSKTKGPPKKFTTRQVLDVVKAMPEVTIITTDS